MSLGVFILAVILVASSGVVFRPGAWYRALAKPVWTPPNWVFGPAWMLLYALIAYAGWRVWEAASPEAAAFPMTVYALQLGLNAGWSAIFFGLCSRSFTHPFSHTIMQL